MLAALVVLLFYGAMLLMPLSGYLMSSFGGYTIHLFGIKLPEWIAPNQDLGRFAHSAHAFGGWFFVTCIGLHVMGTLKHFLLDRVNLLKRMW
jgi:cytochrome b561